jgi:hypothetical protein
MAYCGGVRIRIHNIDRRYEKIGGSIVIGCGGRADQPYSYGECKKTFRP